jgi:hypothetical protein
MFPARPSEAADKPRLHGVALQIEGYNRDRAGCILHCPDTGRTAYKDHVDLSLHEISGEPREGVLLQAGEPDVESYRLALDVAEIAQALARRIDRD